MKRTNTESVINFIYFTSNFSGGFIDAAFAGDDHLRNHLNEKFLQCIAKSGKTYCTLQSFMSFMFELSTDNKRILIDWINENYNCGMI